MERWRVVDGWMPCIERLGRWYAVAESEIWDAAWRGQSVVGRHHQTSPDDTSKVSFSFTPPSPMSIHLQAPARTPHLLSSNRLDSVAVNVP